jgi:hypothetical protein
VQVKKRTNFLKAAGLIEIERFIVIESNVELVVSILNPIKNKKVDANVQQKQNTTSMDRKNNSKPTKFKNHELIICIVENEDDGKVENDVDNLDDEVEQKSKKEKKLSRTVNLLKVLNEKPFLMSLYSIGFLKEEIAIQPTMFKLAIKTIQKLDQFFTTRLCNATTTTTIAGKNGPSNIDYGFVNKKKNNDNKNKKIRVVSMVEKKIIDNMDAKSALQQDFFFFTFIYTTINILNNDNENNSNVNFKIFKNKMAKNNFLPNNIAIEEFEKKLIFLKTFKSFKNKQMMEQKIIGIENSEKSFNYFEFEEKKTSSSIIRFNNNNHKNKNKNGYIGESIEIVKKTKNKKLLRKNSIENKKNKTSEKIKHLINKNKNNFLDAKVDNQKIIIEKKKTKNLENFENFFEKNFEKNVEKKYENLRIIGHAAGAATATFLSLIFDGSLNISFAENFNDDEKNDVVVNVDTDVKKNCKKKFNKKNIIITNKKRIILINKKLRKKEFNNFLLGNKELIQKNTGLFKNKTNCLLVAPPPCLSRNLIPRFLTSVVCGDDFFCRCTQNSLKIFSDRVVKALQSGAGKKNNVNYFLLSNNWMRDLTSFTGFFFFFFFFIYFFFFYFFFFYYNFFIFFFF